MAYLASDIINSAINRGKDPSFSRNLALEYLNAIHSEVLGNKRFTFLEVSTTLTLALATNSVGTPIGFQVALGLALTDGTTTSHPDYVAYRVFNGLTPPTTAGRPAKWTIFGETFKFAATADKNYTVNLDYLRVPTQLTAESIAPDIPDEYKEILTLGVLAGIEEHRENIDIAAVYRRRIEDLTDDLLGRYSVRQLLSAGKQTRSRFRTYDS
jgi:hypothetical protein